MKENEIFRTNLDKNTRFKRIVWLLFCFPIIGYDKDDNIVFRGTNLMAAVGWLIIISIMLAIQSSVIYGV